MNRNFNKVISRHPESPCLNLKLSTWDWIVKRGESHLKIAKPVNTRWGTKGKSWIQSELLTLVLAFCTISWSFVIYTNLILDM